MAHLVSAPSDAPQSTPLANGPQGPGHVRGIRSRSRAPPKHGPADSAIVVGTAPPVLPRRAEGRGRRGAQSTPIKER